MHIQIYYVMITKKTLHSSLIPKNFKENIYVHFKGWNNRNKGKPCALHEGNKKRDSYQFLLNVSECELYFFLITNDTKVTKKTSVYIYCVVFGACSKIFIDIPAWTRNRADNASKLHFRSLIGYWKHFCQTYFIGK